MSPTKIALAMCFVAPIAFADPYVSEQDPRTTRTPDYCVLSDVIGAKVKMHPGAKAVAEASKEGENADRPKGKVSNVLVDTCDGSVAWAVVAFDKTLGFGGKTVLVPCDLLAWNKADECFDLAQSDDQLKALPEFDADDARKNGIDGKLRAVAPHWPNAVIEHRHELAERDPRAGTDRKTTGSDDVKKACPMVMIDERPCSCAKPQFVLATDIDSAKVHAQDGEFGKVTTNVIDRANRRIALLAVKADGDEFLFPFDSLCLHENEKGRAYCTAHTKAQLEAAVRYEKPDHGCIDPVAANRAKEFFAKLDGKDLHDHR